MSADQKIMTFLMFTGEAEEAMNYYTSIFSDSRILTISRYGANEAGPEGSVIQATFSLAGQVFMCSDSFVKHNFTFTPSMSIWVSCGTVAEIDDYFSRLSGGGMVLMPLQEYPFSKRFAWVQDKFGISWQLSMDRD